MRLLTALFCISVFLGSAAAQPPKSGLSPCALLTKAEVQQAVGSPVSEGAINPSSKLYCDFKVGGAGSVVSVTLTAKARSENARTTVAAYKMLKVSAQVIPGFGDSAYTASPAYGTLTLGVFKGSNHVAVSVLLVGAPEARSKTIAQALMRKALARLP